MNNLISRNKMLASRIQEVFLSGHWIANTNYKELLQNVSLQQATQKMDQVNSIAALVYHINYYLEGLLYAMENGKLEIHDKYSFNLPRLETESGWNKLVSGFLNNAEKFAAKIEQMDDSIFDKPFVDEKYGTYLRNIEGVIEHSYYHLGQIALLKKLV
ncbi:MAG: DinB family protein [Bacteroidetes bacterium]|nr:DinB family protein [Bacteroidota bacterium]MBS1931733.1 DinB family protein [Bacteroidota bacterium]